MKSTYVFLFLVAIISISSTKSEKTIKNCQTISEEENNSVTTTESYEDETEKPCPQTDYNAYIECIRQREEKAYQRKINQQQKTTKERKKREICDDANECSECSGTSCSNCGNPSCDNSCSNCRGTSCSNCNACSTCKTTQCCHQYCNYNCRSSTCRTACKKDCGSSVISAPIAPIVRDGGASAGSSKSNTSGSQNITMIFNLHNIINNTNEIDIPIHMNSSNINDINIQEHAAEGCCSNAISGNKVNVQVDESEETKDEQNCCHIVLPRTCEYIPKFPFVRCYHRRMRVCGPQCVNQPQPPPRVIALPPEVIWNRPQVINLPPNVYHYPPAVIPKSPETYKVPGPVVHLPPRLLPLPPRTYTLPSSISYVPQIQRLPPSYYPLPPNTNYYFYDQIQTVSNPQPAPIIYPPTPTPTPIGGCYPYICPTSYTGYTGYTGGSGNYVYVIPYGGYGGYGGYSGLGGYGGLGGYYGGYGGLGGYYGGYGGGRYIVVPGGWNTTYRQYPYAVPWWNAGYQYNYTYPLLNRTGIRYPNTGINYPVYSYRNNTDPNSIFSVPSN